MLLIPLGSRDSILHCARRIRMCANKEPQPCKKVTTIPGKSYKVVTSCAPSSRTWYVTPYNNFPTVEATSALPSPTISCATIPQILAPPTPCITWVPAPQSEPDKTCHIYPSTATITTYEDCDPCATSTLDLAPGPVVPQCCETVTHVDEKTVTVKGCRESMLVKRVKEEQ
jgi:hypothetical protein